MVDLAAKSRVVDRQETVRGGPAPRPQRDSPVAVRPNH